MIRQAEEIDIPILVELGLMFYEATPLKSLVDYDMGSIEALIKRIMVDPMGILLVLERGGEVIGGIMGLVVPLYWNNAVLCGQQISLFVRPDKRCPEGIRLLPEFKRLCREKGAQIIFSGAKKNADFPAMDKMLTRQGLFELESMYIGRI
jgi:hypothetical protein